MKRSGVPAFSAAIALFAIFSANVVSGALGRGGYLSDVPEMLLLFAAVIFFVAGILQREAAERSDPV